MLISVTAPRKGLGQTITAINIGAMLTKILKNEKIIFVDTNQYCKDIEYYLSDATFTKGLDEFISLHNSGLLNEESFSSCIKKMKFNIDIMSAHKFYEITEDNIKALTECANELYNFTIVDASSGNNNASEHFFDRSEMIVVVLNPIKGVIKMVDEIEAYKKHKDKLIFVVNRYVEKMGGVKLEYKIPQIKKELREMGFDSPVFPLQYDVELINECNYGAVLNFVLGANFNDINYIFNLEKIVEYALRKHTKYDVSDVVVRKKKSKALRYFDLIKKYNIKILRRYFTR